MSYEPNPSFYLVNCTFEEFEKVLWLRLAFFLKSAGWKKGVFSFEDFEYILGETLAQKIHLTPRQILESLIQLGGATEVSDGFQLSQAFPNPQTRS